MKKPSKIIRLLLLTMLLSLSVVQPALAQDELPVIRAVLFFSPTCGHCHQVISEDLPPLFEQYGDQLQIVGLDTSTPQGSSLFTTAIQYYQIPADRAAVPFLIVGGTVLIGSYEIPTEFPGIIKDGLASGGIDWPEFPGLAEVIAGIEGQQADTTEGESQAEPVAAEPEQAAETTNLAGLEAGVADTRPVSERFLQDPLANGIAVMVLLAMVGSAVVVGSRFNNRQARLPKWPLWVIPALVVVGLIAAGYLSYVEISNTEAACGPVGDCNRVQQSPYATLFGFLPIGILGLAGYVVILISWGLQHFGPEHLRARAALALWAFAGFGLAFSIYLTFLEPFVIGATCAWCVTSAIVMTLIFWAASEPARQARKA